MVWSGPWAWELDASVLARIPVRTNTDDRYFSDPHQALPKHGYTRIFENMAGVRGVRGDVCLAYRCTPHGHTE